MFNLIGYLIIAILVLINFVMIFPMQYQRFLNDINTFYFNLFMIRTLNMGHQQTSYS